METNKYTMPRPKGDLDASNLWRSGLSKEWKRVVPRDPATMASRASEKPRKPAKRVNVE